LVAEVVFSWEMSKFLTVAIEKDSVCGGRVFQLLREWPEKWDDWKEKKKSEESRG
tara:strand:+ start:935 stop:1099 length:165 start_codon:yes stop_codon:yes gene_type:complete